MLKERFPMERFLMEPRCSYEVILAQTEPVFQFVCQ